MIAKHDKHQAGGMNNKKVAFSCIEKAVEGDISDPAGTRTQDPRLKRAMLYQLSYEIKFSGVYLPGFSKLECKFRP